MRGSADLRTPEFEMTASRRVTIAASGLFIVSMAASVLVLRHLDRIRSGATLQEVLYISSPKVLKRLSLGYDGLLADIYWTRAVQYFGSKHFEGAREYALLGPLLEITTTLDPHLTVAYEFGANFLAPKPPDGAGQPQQAVALAKFGIQNNPDDWKLYSQLGFIYYMDLKDYPDAADAFLRGSKIPNAHPWLKIMAAQMAEHAGELRTAQMMWTMTYQSSHDKNVRANAVAHLRALQTDEDVTALEHLVSQYKQRTGHLPESFGEMERAGWLHSTPLDPLGHAYKLMPDGHVEVRVPDDLPFIEKGTPPGYVAPPPKFLPSD
jgi:tetratricopeptide (TPR) repeat protein